MTLSASRPADRVQRVVLIGLRGAGKTTVGRLLAAKLTWRFIDTDAEVEQRAGCTIREYFAQAGEAQFRLVESEVLRDACGQSEVVIASGGGAALTAENRPLFHAPGSLCVWLDAPASVLARRLQADPKTASQRPLLTAAENMTEELSLLLKERAPLYKRFAQCTIDTDAVAPEAAAEQILRVVQERD